MATQNRGTRTCASCGSIGQTLKRCTACRSVWYCNVSCQKAHRKSHKKECKRIEKELAKELEKEATSKEIDCQGGERYEKIGAERMAIGEAVFTCECELSLRISHEANLDGDDEEQWSLCIRYQRIDREGRQRKCYHEIVPDEMVEMRSFSVEMKETNKMNKYLVLRANSTIGNELIQYSASNTYKPAPNSLRGSRYGQGHSHSNFIAIEMSSADESVGRLQDLLFSNESKFRAAIVGKSYNTVFPEKYVRASLGALLRHNKTMGRGENSEEELKVPVARISKDGYVFTRDCLVTFHTKIEHPYLEIFFNDGESRKSCIFFATSTLSIFNTYGKVPRRSVKPNAYLLLRVYPASDSGLDVDARDYAGREGVPAIPIVIEMLNNNTKEHAVVQNLLSEDPWFSRVYKVLEKPALGKHLTEDLRALSNACSREAGDDNKGSAKPPLLLMWPSEHKLHERRACFICHSSFPPYWDDVPAVIMPCCGTWACVGCYEDFMSDILIDMVRGLPPYSIALSLLFKPNHFSRCTLTLLYS